MGQAWKNTDDADFSRSWLKQDRCFSNGSLIQQSAPTCKIDVNCEVPLRVWSERILLRVEGYWNELSAFVWSVRRRIVQPKIPCWAIWQQADMSIASVVCKVGRKKRMIGWRENTPKQVGCWRKANEPFPKDEFAMRVFWDICDRFKGYLYPRNLLIV